MNKRLLWCAMLLSCASSFGICGLSAADAPPTLELKDNDTVVWLGATFLERMQQFGHCEAILQTASPSRRLRFRNLGWSGDEVTGISRAVFGTVEDGFERLKKDLAIAKPTVVVLQYGAVEAERGESGEAEFGKNLERLLVEVAATKARIVVMTPFYRTRPRSRFPDPALYNGKLDRYCEILSQVTSERQIPLIDIRKLLEGIESHNGLVPTATGYRQLAPKLAAALGHPLPEWKVAIDASTGESTAHATSLVDVEAAVDEVTFQAVDERLIPIAGAGRKFTVTNLKPGSYEVKVGGRQAGVYTHAQLAEGVTLPPSAGSQPAEQLRLKLVEKNQLFFHRHRPQNETYLFLFRKHEQGNNAVEIPQFDPLITRVEARIAELQIPRPQVYQVRRKP